MVSMGRFHRGTVVTWSMALHGKSKRTLATRLTTVCLGLRLFLQMFTTVLQTLTTVLQTLATICGKINSQRNFEHVKMLKNSLRQEKLFATIKTVCELVCNLLRTLTKSWRIQNSLRSQAFAALCDTPLRKCYKNIWQILPLTWHILLFLSMVSLYSKMLYKCPFRHYLQCDIIQLVICNFLFLSKIMKGESDYFSRLQTLTRISPQLKIRQNRRLIHIKCKFINEEFHCKTG